MCQLHAYRGCTNSSKSCMWSVWDIGLLVVALCFLQHSCSIFNSSCIAGPGIGLLMRLFFDISEGFTNIALNPAKCSCQAKHTLPVQICLKTNFVLIYTP